MLRKEIENALIAEYSNENASLMKVNFKNILKPQLEQLVETGEITLSGETLAKILLERNERSANNSRLALETSRLRNALSVRLETFTDYSRSEVLQLFGVRPKLVKPVLKNVKKVA